MFHFIFKIFEEIPFIVQYFIRLKNNFLTKAPLYWHKDGRCTPDICHFVQTSG